MAEKKRKLKQFVSPAGVALFPCLVGKPDEGSEEFPKDNPEWNVRLIFDEDQAEDLREKLEGLYQQALKDAKKEFQGLKASAKRKFKGQNIAGPVPVEYLKPEIDEETEEETGRYIANFKTRAHTKEGKLKKLPIFDAKGTPVKGIDAIWGNSVLKVAFAAAPFFVKANALAGLTLYLNAVQIIDLVAPGSGNAESYGFGAEEGFEADESFQNEESDDDEYEDGSDDDGEDEGDF